MRMSAFSVIILCGDPSFSLEKNKSGFQIAFSTSECTKYAFKHRDLNKNELKKLLEEFIGLINSIMLLENEKSFNRVLDDLLVFAIGRPQSN
jgi:hypothetical protein